MRHLAIWTVVAALFAVSMISRLGTDKDIAIRSRCAAIGSALQQRAVAKAVDVADLRARPTKTAVETARLVQWDIYIDHLDLLGRGLVENFNDPWPTSAYDRWWVQQRDTRALTEAGEACTG